MQKLKAVAERLMGPEIVDPRAAANRKTPSNQSWRAAAGGRRLREMLGMLGAAARRASVCALPKNRSPRRKWPCEQPNNHSAAALHLVPRGRPQASIVLSA